MFIPTSVRAVRGLASRFPRVAASPGLAFASAPEAAAAASSSSSAAFSSAAAAAQGPAGRVLVGNIDRRFSPYTVKQVLPALLGVKTASPSSCRILDGSDQLMAVVDNVPQPSKPKKAAADADSSVPTLAQKKLVVKPFSQFTVFQVQAKLADAEEAAAEAAPTASQLAEAARALLRKSDPFSQVWVSVSGSSVGFTALLSSTVSPASADELLEAVAGLSGVKDAEAAGSAASVSKLWLWPNLRADGQLPELAALRDGLASVASAAQVTVDPAFFHLQRVDLPGQFPFFEMVASQPIIDALSAAPVEELSKSLGVEPRTSLPVPEFPHLATWTPQGAVGSLERQAYGDLLQYILRDESMDLEDRKEALRHIPSTVGGPADVPTIPPPPEHQ